MPFHTQAEAKRFFVDRILEQARMEGARLTSAEAYMLNWSESDPDFPADPKMDGQFAEETDEAQFEEKIVGLVRRAFEADCAKNASSKDAYKEARSRLEEGDHYLLVMIGQALE